jgi:hypothetical protein
MGIVLPPDRYLLSLVPEGAVHADVAVADLSFKER